MSWDEHAFARLEGEYEFRKLGYEARGVWEMAKTMPAEGGTDRADWVKDDYVVELITTEETEKREATPGLVLNPFYHTAEALTEKYGDPVEGERYWLSENGSKEYASWPEDEHQWSLTLKVIDGDYKDRWLFVFASPRFYPKKDKAGGVQWGGKLAQMYLAAMPDFDLSQGIEDDLSDLIGKPFRVSAGPKDGNAKFGKVTDFLPLKKGWKRPPEELLKDAGAVEFGEEVPF